MNKVFSIAAASVFSIGALAANAEKRTEPLHPIEEYLWTPEKTELDNCGFIIPLEFPQEEFYRRMEAGEEIDDRLSFGHHYLYTRNDDLPRVIINETDGLIDIFLSTAAIEGQQHTVFRVERPDDTITIDNSPLSEHLIQIDTKNAVVSLKTLSQVRVILSKRRTCQRLLRSIILN